MSKMLVAEMSFMFVDVIVALYVLLLLTLIFMRDSVGPSFQGREGRQDTSVNSHQSAARKYLVRACSYLVPFSRTPIFVTILTDGLHYR
jgi:hypothetical protein